MSIESWFGEALTLKALLVAPLAALLRSPSGPNGAAERVQDPLPLLALEAPVQNEPEPDPPTAPEQPPEKPRRLKAPHTAEVAAKRFHAYMVETQQGDGIRSFTVYAMYIDWCEEVEGREILRHEPFLRALSAVPGVVKKQVQVITPDHRASKSRRWWFEAAEKPPVMHTAKRTKPAAKRAKKKGSRR